mgnify:FL=1
MRNLTPSANGGAVQEGPEEGLTRCGPKGILALVPCNATERTEPLGDCEPIFVDNTTDRWQAIDGDGCVVATAMREEDLADAVRAKNSGELVPYSAEAVFALSDLRLPSTR